MLGYSVWERENNGRNMMFKNMVNSGERESFIGKVIGDWSFEIGYREEEMWGDDDKA